MRDNDLKIFAGNAHPDLAREISEYLYLELSRIQVDRVMDQLRVSP